MTQYVKKRFDTAPQGCEACSRPSSPVFRPLISPPDQSKGGKKKCPPILRKSVGGIVVCHAPQASADFSAVSCYFAIPAKLQDLRREGRCYFLVSSLFAADLRQSKKKEARNRCGFGLLEKAIYLLKNWGARRAAFRPYFTKPKLDFA